MSDSRKWAAEQEDERYEATDEYKQLKRRCVEWNAMMAVIETRQFLWNLDELRFLIKNKTTLHPRWHSCSVADFNRLKVLFEKCL